MQPEKNEAAEAESERLLARLRDYAKDKPFRFNPDEKVVDGLIRAMVRRKEKTGDWHCPCRVVTGDREKDGKIVCPCAYHEAEVKRDGHCHCWLFVRKEAQT